MPPWSQLLAVALGAVLGAWLRWGLSTGLNAVTWPVQSPLGTLLANWLGALLMGMAMGVFAAWPQLRPEWRLLVNTGFLGALTTFSTWSAEAVALVAAGHYSALLIHLGLHACGSVLATLMGLALVRACWIG